MTTPLSDKIYIEIVGITKKLPRHPGWLRAWNKKRLNWGLPSKSKQNNKKQFVLRTKENNA